MLIARVVSVDGNSALLELPDGTDLALSREEFRGPWRDIRPRADVEVLGLEEGEGRLFITSGRTPTRPGAWERQIEELTPEDRAFDASPEGQRQAEILREADAAIAESRRRRKEDS